MNIPLAVLSTKPHLLYDYFKQVLPRFTQSADRSAPRRAGDFEA